MAFDSHGEILSGLFAVASKIVVAAMGKLVNRSSHAGAILPTFSKNSG